MGRRHILCTLKIAVEFNWILYKLQNPRDTSVGSVSDPHWYPIFFLFLWAIFALLDPGPADQNQCGSIRLPDSTPEHCGYCY